MNLKFSKIEGKVLDFIQKHLLEIFLIIITLLALYVRYKFRGYKSGDFVKCLNPWFMDLRNNGGLMAIKHYKGDYACLYIFILALLSYIPLKPIILIKGLSIIFDFGLSLSGSLLVYKLLKGRKHQKFITVLTYGILLFLPTVVINSSMWAQCDSIYTTFVLLSLSFLIDEKYTKSFIMLGIALAFKLQFIFILPMYIMYYLLNRKFSIINFLIIPITTFICCLPAIFLGRPIADSFSVYFFQVGEYSKNLTMYVPNIYNFLPNLPNYFRTFGLVLTVVVFGTMLFILMYKKVKFNKENILLFGILSILISSFFLPNMHERYMYMADVLTVIYCLVYKKRYYLALTVNFMSLLVYVPSVVFPTPKVPYIFELKYLAIFYMLAIFIFTYSVFKEVLKKSKD